MVKRTFFQKIGLAKVKLGRPEQRAKTKIQWFAPLQPTSLVGRDKKSTQIKFTKREKKIGLANVEGAGVGFVIGTALGGFTGMVVGVPLGTYAGNVIGKRRAGKQVGRPLKYTKKQNFIGKLLSTKGERIEYNKTMMSGVKRK